MTPIALMRALIRWAETIRRNQNEGTVTGRRAEKMLALFRARWIARPEGPNRHQRRSTAKAKVLLDRKVRKQMKLGTGRVQ